MFHKVANVKPDGALFLRVEFVNGEVRRYDVSQLFAKFPVFLALKKPELFDTVRVDPGGYGISWNEDIDLSCDELYHMGIPQ